jgi:hypothetical protein
MTVREAELLRAMKGSFRYKTWPKHWSRLSSLCQCALPAADGGPEVSNWDHGREARSKDKLELHLVSLEAPLCCSHCRPLPNIQEIVFERKAMVEPK